MLNRLTSAMPLSAVALFATLATALPANAMNVSPMAVELSSTGAKSTARIQVSNENAQPLPFETRVYRIDFDANGQVVETPADADFLVFPPQGVVRKDQRQMIRVQWIGGPLDSSRGYYIAINQIPVVLEPTTTTKDKPQLDVQVVYHMKVLTTVAPPGASPKVAVESVRSTLVPSSARPDATHSQPAMVPGITAIIRNTGKRYAMLAGVAWTLEGRGMDGKPLRVVLSSGQVGELLGAGYVPALDGRRTFMVPTGVQFSNAPIKLKFSN
jgi:fimbrial chaperone protein